MYQYVFVNYNMLVIKRVDGQIKYALEPNEESCNNTQNTKHRQIELHKATKTTPRPLHLRQYKPFGTWYQENQQHVNHIVDVYTLTIDSFLSNNPNYTFSFNKPLFQDRLLHHLYKTSSSRSKTFV